MRAVLLALLAVAAASGCLCVGIFCPSTYGYKDWSEYRRAELDYRKGLAQPAVDALEAHRAAEGTYPERLDDLVAAGRLPAVPDLAVNADHQGKPDRVEKAGPLEYRPVADRTAYRLWIVFSYVEQAGMSQKDQCWEYSSADKSWRLINPARRHRPDPPPAQPAPPAEKP